MHGRLPLSMAKIVEELTKLYDSYDWDDHELQLRSRKSLGRKDKNRARQKRLMAGAAGDGFGSAPLLLTVHGKRSHESCCTIS